MSSKTTESQSNYKRLGGNGCGTAVVAADFTPSAGFGATASVSVATGSTDMRGEITITAAGAGTGANPTCAFVFKDGAYEAAPFVVVCATGGSQPTVPWTVTSRATTGFTVTFNGTASAAETYKLAWHVIG